MNEQYEMQGDAFDEFRADWERGWNTNSDANQTRLVLVGTEQDPEYGTLNVWEFQ